MKDVKHYTLPLRQQILTRMAEKIGQGLPKCYAAQAEGVPDGTIDTWLRHKDLAEYKELFKKKTAEYIQSLVKKVEMADDWKAQCWLLERRASQQFGHWRKNAHTIRLDDESKKALLDKDKKLADKLFILMCAMTQGSITIDDFTELNTALISISTSTDVEEILKNQQLIMQKMKMND